FRLRALVLAKSVWFATARPARAAGARRTAGAHASRAGTTISAGTRRSGPTYLLRGILLFKAILPINGRRSCMKQKIMGAGAGGPAVLATAGVAMATTFLAPPTTAKACVASSGALKLKQNGGCPAGSKPITLLGKGARGTALGYAHIK